ncbi:hypothetical protein CTA1_8256 [Colletotrichum tanaceti]|uniref:Uncharacterized protein n=1 Tax=Colletotrichum tanaceti TaxID=1306861 RepID=A0A4U6XJL5_9PEZI|nr:hypothetical protein CTA1_8256 [Colletotrichum tanaceti]
MTRRVLDETFAPRNMQFVVKNLTHTVNDAWTRQVRVKKKAEALRQGAYFENSATSNNQRKAARVRGFGHWFGLFHVFVGFNCYGEGYLIDGRPATMVATIGCPEVED